MYEKKFKEAFDIGLAIILLICLSPVFLLVWIAVKLQELNAPAIFKQTRCGKNKKPFTLYKFRSMVSEAPSELSTKEFEDSDKYQTKLGKFLRMTSLDELPQLINVIKGDMSFVGPRPVIYQEKELICKRDEMGVYELLPGITGYAQVMGRDDICIMKKAKYDADYRNNITFVRDLWILFVTIPYVFLKKGNKDNKKNTIL